MTEFYRFHWDDCPAFGADNAWSTPWGGERSEDGSGIRCPVCDGEGFDFSDVRTCTTCDGTGWESADYGYSCCWTGEDLLAYFSPQAHHSGPPKDDDGTVIVFRGEHVGNGCDGEPLAVPAEIIATMAWSEFAARHADVGA